MTEFTLYCFQCIPFRMNFPKDKDGVMFREEMDAWDRQVLENMKNHQALIDKILTKDLHKYFESQKPSNKSRGGLDKCLAFYHNNKRYYFKVLLPHETSGWTWRKVNGWLSWILMTFTQLPTRCR